jgi:hypothetical protein
MMNPNEIVNLGKRIVSEQLKKVGWEQVRADNQVPNPVDVVAMKGNKSILVAVTPTVHPKVPGQLNQQMLGDLKRLASQSNADMYQAKVVIAPDMTRATSISWRKL